MITYDTVSFHTLQLIYQNFGDRQIQIGVQGPQALDEITRMGTSLSRRHKIALLAHTNAL